MKNKVLISLCIIQFIVIISLIILLNVGFFNENYILTIGDKTTIIPIPKYSLLWKKNNQEITFKSFASHSKIDEIVGAYFAKFRKIECSIDQNTYYFDNRTGLTIFDYDVNKKGIINEFHFKFYNGNYCNDLEKEIVEEEWKEFNFKVSVISIPNCQDEGFHKYYQGKDYNIYTSCLSNIFVKSEDATKSLTDTLIEDNDMINKMIRDLELTSKYAQGTIINHDDGSILYSNYHYSVLSCPVNNGKKNYIIGNAYFDFEQPVPICDKLDH